MEAQLENAATVTQAEEVAEIPEVSFA